jgi:hypothetical protein
MDKKIKTQSFVIKKTDDEYYVEVFNDDKLAWTDTYETEERLFSFIKCCSNTGSTPCLSQDEARIMLENNEFGVDIFYRHPKGLRFASIFHLDVWPETNEHGFEVFFTNRDGEADEKNVPTIDEAFQVLKDVENGKI